MTLPTFIRPGSNHCIAWSLTFVTFGTLGLLGLDATQACEDTWSKIIDVVAADEIGVVESFGDDSLTACSSATA